LAFNLPTTLPTTDGEISRAAKLPENATALRNRVRIVGYPELGHVRRRYRKLKVKGYGL
jgi:hypothetical protein